MDFSISDNPAGSIAGTHRFRHEAMATVFEIFISYPDGRYAEQAAYAAFDELDRLEGEFSRFIPNSDISQLNELSAGRSLQVSPEVFECLQLCKKICGQTNRAFDVTIGAAADCWFDKKNKTPLSPSQEQLDQIRRQTGMDLLGLDSSSYLVTPLAGKMTIDLGGIGKGFAADKMAALLAEWGIENMLVNAGFSTVLCTGSPKGEKGWPVTISDPFDSKKILSRLCLNGRALSGSGLRAGRHIIDPRTLRPVEARCASWSVAPDAASADALSTAFMVMTDKEIKHYCDAHKDTLALIAAADGDISHFGPWQT